MKLLPIAALALAAALPAQAQLSNFGWFAELAGSCWRGEGRTDGRYDVQCYSTQYNRFMRGTIKFYQADKLTGEGDSVFRFDPDARAIIYAQWASNGSFGVGEATLENNELIFQNRLPDGEEAPTRTVWRRGADPDTFRVSRQRRGDAGAYREESSVSYTRVRAAAAPKAEPPRQ